MTSIPDPDGLPTSRRYAVMACLLLGAVLATLDGAIANIALPTLAHDLMASESATVWVVNGYQLAVAISLLPCAAIGEIWGQKKLYMAGLVLFGLASLACALSQDLTMLVTSRVLQGLGGAAIAVTGPSFVRAVYPRTQMASGFALIAMTVAISAAVGPSIAALILSVARWPWLFLVNVPLCLVALPSFFWVAPAVAGRWRPFDTNGALLSGLALGLVVVGVDLLGNGISTLAVVVLAAGLASGVVLVLHQGRRTDPMFPLDLLRIPVFGLSVLTSICSYAAQILAYVSLPFLFETVMHRSATATGLLVTPWPVMVAVAAPYAGRLTRRYPAGILSSIGMAILALGLLLLSVLPEAPADWDIAWRMGLCGVGFGFFQTPNNTTLMTAGPAARSGAASGMLAVARTFGWCLGSALVAVVFGLSPSNGTRVCLAVAAGFAVVGALVSSARLVAPR